MQQNTDVRTDQLFCHGLIFAILLVAMANHHQYLHALTWQALHLIHFFSQMSARSVLLSYTRYDILRAVLRIQTVKTIYFLLVSAVKKSSSAKDHARLDSGIFCPPTLTFKPIKIWQLGGILDSTNRKMLSGVQWAGKTCSVESDCSVILVLSNHYLFCWNRPLPKTQDKHMLAVLNVFHTMLLEFQKRLKKLKTLPVKKRQVKWHIQLNVTLCSRNTENVLLLSLFYIQPRKIFGVHCSKLFNLTIKLSFWLIIIHDNKNAIVTNINVGY